jgi:hypothetical protein
MVDPQLKNNQKLVEILYIFESSWEKGKEYLLDTKKYAQLLYFSQMIEILCDKYKDLSEQLENRDPNILVWIPSILILKSLDNEDKGICYEFIPNMFSKQDESGKLYCFLKTIKENLYVKLSGVENVEEIQKFIQKNEIDEFLKNMKILSMQMQRIKPTEWNNFFDLAMDSVYE